MENLSIYNAVRSVPEEAQKQIKGGRLSGMTDINPMWRIKMLTETFGPVGFGWYTKVLEQSIQEGAGDERIACVRIHLFVKMEGEWSQPIEGIGGSAFTSKERNGVYTSDECFKMAYTDAISVACKALGMGADIYWQADRTKYDLQQQVAAQKQQRQTAIEEAFAAMTLDNIKSREQFEAAFKIGRSLGLDKDNKYKEAAMVVAAQYPKTA